MSGYYALLAAALAVPCRAGVVTRVSVPEYSAPAGLPAASAAPGQMPSSLSLSPSLVPSALLSAPAPAPSSPDKPVPGGAVVRPEAVKLAALMDCARALLAADPLPSGAAAAPVERGSYLVKRKGEPLLA